MKYCIVILDGITDRKYTRINKKTPLEIARTFGLDEISTKGCLGMVQTIPPNFPCNTIVSTMSILGLDPNLYYTGIAPLEAKDQQIEMHSEDWSFCCDFVSLSEGNMADPQAGKLFFQESINLLQDLQQYLGKEDFHFLPLYQNHHLLCFPKGKFRNIQTKDPFDLKGKPIKKHYPVGEGSEQLIEIMEKAHEFLQNHDINKVRRDLGENLANGIWIWSGGQIPFLPPWSEIFGLKAALVAHSYGVRGLSKILGIQIIDVPGATGTWETNYAEKTKQALQAIENVDCVFIHIGSLMDVARYHGVSDKVRAIESIDSYVIRPLLQKLPSPFRLMVVGGHYISAEDGISQNQPVPFAIIGEDFPGSGRNLTFTEQNAKKVDINIANGEELLRFFLK
ncbi:MAG: hypothetical protein KBC30_05930 [Planctomycetes bacterium]|jgi:2,3-bisphosphoglycerate-independent phosphoglycerate mutase|nr:hypothetical protein [Planctomycetota bacterium]HNZ65973.1 hypothetical protein [Planctomycetota bacterium]HON44199.1 hypothetical protein [Planctomycetota bacterium]HPY74123.1 hypothetical protein [Planctomycetota bacterium]HQA99669.1 hypothetical protein [Planctomycetota bacterium]